MLKYFIALFIIVQTGCKVQSQQARLKVKEKDSQVRITNWHRITVMFDENFWEKSRDEIVKQIGESEFEKVKANSGFSGVPSEMSLYDGRKRRDTSELYPKLAQLNLYHIATIPNTGSKGGNFAILRCPYAENKNWDVAVKWDTVYFVLHESYIEKIWN
jgi:hypothetical protein